MHEGHRARLWGKIKNRDGLYEHEILEALLFNCCPRKDLNGVAHNLIDAFGSIEGALGADADELCGVDGVGKNMAEYLVCLGLCLKNATDGDSFATLRNTEDFRNFVRARSCGRDVVELYFLDKDMRVKRVHSFPFPKAEENHCADELVRVLFAFKPDSVYAARFKPCGGCLPTSADDACAETIKAAGAFGGIKLNDYGIVDANGNFYSYFMTDRIYALRGE